MNTNNITGMIALGILQSLSRMALLLFDWLERDGILLLAARMVRMFAYGFLSIILAIYLKLIGFRPSI